MKRSPRQHWHRAQILLLISLVMLFGAIARVEAQDTGAKLLLRPHCAPDADPATCTLYEVEDPETLRTEEFAVGETLDMDLVAENPSGSPIGRVRSWLTYDPTVLEGTSIEIGEALPIATPGEADFSASEGSVKIEASAPEGEEKTDGAIVVARIKLRVRSAPPAGTVIGFFDVQRGGHTTVAAREAGEETEILSDELGVLHVRMKRITKPKEEETPSEEAEAPPAETATGAVAEPPAAPEPPSPRVPFTLLQIQNLRVTTEGGTVYLAWDPMPSTQLKAYNVYYGTISGQYLQRRSITPQNASLTIRGLPENTQYYFAVRGVNSQDQESTFSQEAAVTVGDPTTSTAPLIPGRAPEVTLPPTLPEVERVPGETGPASVLALLAIASAVIGTAFAWRRQFVVQPA